MRCPNCNSEISENDQYCPVCLYEIKKITKETIYNDSDDEINDLLEEDYQKSKKKKLTTIIIALILVVALCVIGIFRLISDDTAKNVVVDDSQILYTLYDDNDVGIHIIELDDYELTFYLENKTSKKLVYDVECVSINGLSGGGWSYETLKKNSSTTDEIDLYFDYDVDIGEFSDLYFTITVRTDSDYQAIINETAHIYPLGEDQVTIYKREIPESDITLLDTKDVLISYIEAREDKNYYYLDMYFENNSSKDLYYRLDECFINGIEIEDASTSIDVYSDNVGFDYIFIDKDTLDELNIDDIDKLTLDIEITDLEYNAYYYDTVSITIGE